MNILTTLIFKQSRWEGVGSTGVRAFQHHVHRAHSWQEINLGSMVCNSIAKILCLGSRFFYVNVAEFERFDVEKIENMSNLHMEGRGAVYPDWTKRHKGCL